MKRQSMYSAIQDSTGTSYPTGVEMKRLLIRAVNDNFRKEI